MTNESVIKMLENLVADYDNLLADIQGRILKSGDSLQVAREELKKELVELEINDRVSANNQIGFLVHIADKVGHPYGDKIYLVEWLDNEQLFHGYFDRKDITKCWGED